MLNGSEIQQHSKFKRPEYIQHSDKLINVVEFWCQTFLATALLFNKTVTKSKNSQQCTSADLKDP